MSYAASAIADGSGAANLSNTTLPPADVIKPIEVLRSQKYSEGIVIDREGNLYFSQTKAGTITVLPPNATPRLWAKVEGANGHKIMSEGFHIVAAKNSVVKLDANGQIVKVVAREFNGKPLQYPNDITIDKQGGFYFTDSGNSNSQTPNGAVYYVSATEKISQVAKGLAFVNGIVLTPDSKRLFVAESNKNRILEYNVLSPGKVKSQKVFAELPVKQGKQIDNQPDGMCIDAQGNLYVAHYGMGQVQVLNPKGQLLRRYSSGNLTTSNCAFGGSDMKHLFVTGGVQTEEGQGGIFRLDLGVRGLDIRPRSQGTTSIKRDS
ncbi:SMP-30/gluconolactonase/LRE family protein [Nostoc edaphicum]|uniref:SMP-30/gluconolactonase/LRE family protein n=1 Tax=Nostoc edaphicum TaxID=264686 RepID=UPI001EECD7A4|nr:SMP-30/gluconolactonase/LRE family protein [Nostoc edaphicum]